MIMMTVFMQLSLNPSVWIGLGAIVLFCLTLSILIIVNSVRNKHSQQKKEQEYRENYIRRVKLSDMLMFGTIEAEFDTLTGILKAENIRMPKFGAQMPNAIFVDNYTDADNETVLRQMNIAYAEQQDILMHMAEAMRRLMETDEEMELAAVSEMAEQIMVTDFQFSHSQDSLVMLIAAGAEYNNVTFSLSALYRPDSECWEYEAEKIECPI
ncbi:MAG: hypothetical protein MJ065_00680 [Oscillospiraceae bacterium]|nr:hypothetical protein [Oscillospiraceae bacterium]